MGNKKSNKGHSKNAKKGGRIRTPLSGSKEGAFEDGSTESQDRGGKKNKK